MSLPKKIKFIRFGGLNPQRQHRYTSNETKKTFHHPPQKKGFYAFPAGHIETFLLGSTNHPTHKTGKTYWIKDEAGNLISNKGWEYDDKGNISGSKDWEYDDNGNLTVSKETELLLKKRKLSLKYVYSFRRIPENPNCYCQQQKEEEFDCLAAENKEIRAACQVYLNEPFYLAYLKKPKIFTYEGLLWHHLGDYLRPSQILRTSGSWVETTYADYLIAYHKNRHQALKEKHATNKWDDSFKANLRQINPLKNYEGDTFEVFIEKI